RTLHPHPLGWQAGLPHQHPQPLLCPGCERSLLPGPKRHEGDPESQGQDGLQESEEALSSKSKRFLPSPAMVVALLALILALTGTAFAALGKNSVGTRQLKSKSVTTGKIATNAVNASKVADHSLTGQDINIGALGTVPKATQ